MLSVGPRRKTRFLDNQVKQPLGYASSNASHMETFMQADSLIVALAPLVALVLGAIGLGGGCYETLVVDRVWPDNPAVIHRGHGGINRGRFWMLAHSLYELALFVTLWATWSVPNARWGTVAALAVHFATRAWSFAYFIPRALRFEKLPELTEEQKREALRWTQLSRVRPVLEACSVIALCVVILQFALR
jgi:hypothetical protein